jgi:hypothetical protein
MRKHTDKKKKWTVIIVSSFIVFCMVFSIFAIIIDNQDSGMSYNKHSFLTTDYGYKTKISGKYMDFYYYPSELERINISRDMIYFIKSSKGFAFVFNPNDNVTNNLQYIDVLRYDVQLQFNTSVYFGITQESKGYTLPVVSCANATADFPFIVIDTDPKANDGNTGFTVSEENPYCFMMNARLKDLLAAKDRLVYTYYGIMTP